MDLPATQAIDDDEASQPLDRKDEVIGNLEIGNASYPISTGITRIGRHPACQIKLDQETLSKKHAEIEAEAIEKPVFIRDLNSSNRTKINDTKLKPERAYQIKDGDKLTFGKVVAYFKVNKEVDDSMVASTPQVNRKIRPIIPGTPDSFNASTSDSDVSAILGTQTDETNFRRPQLPARLSTMNNCGSPKILQFSAEDLPSPLSNKRNTVEDIYNIETQKASTSNTKDDAEEDIYSALTQKVDIINKYKDIAENIFEMETQKVSHQEEEENQSDIENLETERIECNKSDSPGRESNNFSIHRAETPKKEILEGTIDVSDDSIHTAATQKRTTDVSNDDSIDNLETEKFDLRDESSSIVQADVSIYSAETQKIDSTGKRPHSKRLSSNDVSIYSALTQKRTSDIMDNDTIENMETQKLDAHEKSSNSSRPANVSIYCAETQKSDSIENHRASKRLSSNDVHSALTQKRVSEIPNHELDDLETQQVDGRKSIDSSIYDAETQKNDLTSENLDNQQIDNVSNNSSCNISLSVSVNSSSSEKRVPQTSHIDSLGNLETQKCQVEEPEQFQTPTILKRKSINKSLLGSVSKRVTFNETISESIEDVETQQFDVEKSVSNKDDEQLEISSKTVQKDGLDESLENLDTQKFSDKSSNNVYCETDNLLNVSKSRVQTPPRVKRLSLKTSMQKVEVLKRLSEIEVNESISDLETQKLDNANSINVLVQNSINGSALNIDDEETQKFDLVKNQSIVNVSNICTPGSTKRLSLRKSSSRISRRLSKVESAESIDDLKTQEVNNDTLSKINETSEQIENQENDDESSTKRLSARKSSSRISRRLSKVESAESIDDLETQKVNNDTLSKINETTERIDNEDDEPSTKRLSVRKSSSRISRRLSKVESAESIDELETQEVNNDTLSKINESSEQIDNQENDDEPSTKRLSVRKSSSRISRRLSKIESAESIDDLETQEVNNDTMSKINETSEQIENQENDDEPSTKRLSVKKSSSRISRRLSKIESAESIDDLDNIVNQENYDNNAKIKSTVENTETVQLNQSKLASKKISDELNENDHDEFAPDFRTVEDEHNMSEKADASSTKINTTIEANSADKHSGKAQKDNIEPINNTIENDDEVSCSQNLIENFPVPFLLDENDIGETDQSAILSTISELVKESKDEPNLSKSKNKLNQKNRQAEEVTDSETDEEGVFINNPSEKKINRSKKLLDKSRNFDNDAVDDSETDEEGVFSSGLSKENSIQSNIEFNQGKKSAYNEDMNKSEIDENVNNDTKHDSRKSNVRRNDSSFGIKYLHNDESMSKNKSCSYIISDSETDEDEIFACDLIEEKSNESCSKNDSRMSKKLNSKNESISEIGKQKDPNVSSAEAEIKTPKTLKVNLEKTTVSSSKSNLRQSTRNSFANQSISQHSDSPKTDSRKSKRLSTMNQSTSSSKEMKVIEGTDSESEGNEDIFVKAKSSDDSNIKNVSTTEEVKNIVSENQVKTQVMDTMPESEALAPTQIIETMQVNEDVPSSPLVNTMQATETLAPTQVMDTQSSDEDSKVTNRKSNFTSPSIGQIKNKRNSTRISNVRDEQVVERKDVIENKKDESLIQPDSSKTDLSMSNIEKNLLEMFEGSEAAPVPSETVLLTQQLANILETSEVCEELGRSSSNLSMSSPTLSTRRVSRTKRRRSTVNNSAVISTIPENSTLNLNDTIERNLHKLFQENVNDHKISESEVLMTQQLTNILSSEDDNLENKKIISPPKKQKMNESMNLDTSSNKKQINNEPSSLKESNPNDDSQSDSENYLANVKSKRKCNVIDSQTEDETEQVNDKEIVYRRGTIGFAENLMPESGECLTAPTKTKSRMSGLTIVRNKRSSLHEEPLSQPGIDKTKSAIPKDDRFELPKLSVVISPLADKLNKMPYNRFNVNLNSKQPFENSPNLIVQRLDVSRVSTSNKSDLSDVLDKTTLENVSILNNSKIRDNSKQIIKDDSAAPASANSSKENIHSDEEDNSQTATRRRKVVKKKADAKSAVSKISKDEKLNEKLQIIISKETDNKPSRTNAKKNESVQPKIIMDSDPDEEDDTVPTPKEESQSEMETKNTKNRRGKPVADKSKTESQDQKSESDKNTRSRRGKIIPESDKDESQESHDDSNKSTRSRRNRGNKDSVDIKDSQEVNIENKTVQDTNSDKKIDDIKDSNGKSAKSNAKTTINKNKTKFGNKADDDKSEDATTSKSTRSTRTRATSESSQESSVTVSLKRIGIKNKESPETITEESDKPDKVSTLKPTRNARARTTSESSQDSSINKVSTKRTRNKNKETPESLIETPDKLDEVPTLKPTRSTRARTVSESSQESTATKVSSSRSNRKVKESESKSDYTSDLKPTRSTRNKEVNNVGSQSSQKSVDAVVTKTRNKRVKNSNSESSQESGEISARSKRMKKSDSEIQEMEFQQDKIEQKLVSEEVEISSSQAKRGRGRKARGQSPDEVETSNSQSKTRQTRKRPATNDTSKEDTSETSQADENSSIEEKNTKSTRGRRGRPTKKITETDNSQDSSKDDTFEKPVSRAKRAKVTKATKDNDQSTSEILNSLPSVSISLQALSPRSSRRSFTSPTKAYKVLFTGDKKDAHRKILKKLGGTEVDDPSKCSILITDKFVRTFKFLCALSKGIPIVSSSWLEKSDKVNHFLDWEDYLLKDRVAEKNYKFELKESLKKAREHNFLDGFTILLAPHEQPPTSELKEMVTLNGGKPLLRAPSKWPSNTILITKEENLQSAKKLIAKAPKSVTIHSTEFILTGILRQSANLEEFKICA